LTLPKALVFLRSVFASTFNVYAISRVSLALMLARHIIPEATPAILPR
jgi:hypothetical protein